MTVKPAGRNGRAITFLNSNVDGAVRRGEIVNTINQRAHDFNRYSYSVEIRLQSQIVSID